MFETKDSGKREEYSTGMRRDVQEDKPRFDLLVPECIPYEETLLYRWAMLMTRGAKKYGERNWEKAATTIEQVRFKASAARHFFAWLSGKEDEDHGTAVAFNIQGYETVKYKLKVEESMKDKK